MISYVGAISNQFTMNDILKKYLVLNQGGHIYDKMVVQKKGLLKQESQYFNAATNVTVPKKLFWHLHIFVLNPIVNKSCNLECVAAKRTKVSQIIGCLDI